MSSFMPASRLLDVECEPNVRRLLPAHIPAIPAHYSIRERFSDGTHPPFWGIATPQSRRKVIHEKS